MTTARYRRRVSFCNTRRLLDQTLLLLNTKIHFSRPPPLKEYKLILTHYSSDLHAARGGQMISHQALPGHSHTHTLRNCRTLFLPSAHNAIEKTRTIATRDIFFFQVFFCLALVFVDEERRRFLSSPVRQQCVTTDVGFWFHLQRGMSAVDERVDRCACLKMPAVPRGTHR